MNTIITIGREFGSGGREFARRLAEELKFDYYDKEIITEIAKHTSLSEEYIRNVIEKKPHGLFPITIAHTISFDNGYQIQQMQDVFKAQCEILNSLSEKSNCVIVGRCADYILKNKKPFRIFIYSDLESKVQRCMDRIDNQEIMDKKKLVKQINNINKERAKYYEFYTSQKWGDIKNYDLCINTSNTNIKEIVAIIAKIFK